MSFKKNLIIYVLLVLLLVCCISAVSASDDSFNITSNFDVVSESDDVLASDSVVSESDDVLASDSVVSESDILSDESNENILTDEENIIYVDSKYTGTTQNGSSENPYKTISAAISGSTSTNSIIYIKNGTYSEKSIDIPNGKGFTFIGESVNGVVVNKDGTNPKVFISANLDNVDLSFTNLTFNGQALVKTLNVVGNGNLNMINCIFDKCGSNALSSSKKDSSFTISTTSSTFKNILIKNIIVSSRYFIDYITYQKGNHIVDNVTIDSRASVSTGELNEALVNINYDASVEVDNLKITNLDIITSNLIKNSGKLMIKNSVFTNNVLKTGKTVKTVNGLFNVQNGNLSIESTIISGNTGFDYFIYESGTDSLVDFESCVIINNKYNKGLLNPSETVNLDRNWWGTNDKPDDVIDYWVVMNSSLSKNINEIEVTVDFTKYTDGNNTYELTKLVPEFPVNFKSSNLTFNKDVYTKNGIATAKFISNGDLYIDINVGESYRLDLGYSYIDCNFNGTELGTIDSPYKSISKAVSESTGGETFIIKNGNYAENSPITLINSLTFIGESEGGVIITGGNRGIFNNPFYMSKNIVLSFNNLIIKDVSCAGNNAPLSIGSSVSKLYLNNITFYNCSSQWGSMNIASLNAEINNCKIINSKSTLTSGAINLNNNGTYELKNLVITNVTGLENNVVGVIVCNEKNAVITLDNAQITNVYNSSTVLTFNNKATIKNLKISHAYLIDSDSAVVYMNNCSNLNFEKTTISNVNSTYIFYATGTIVNALSGSVSNVQCDNLFEVSDGSVFNSVSTSISNINCNVVFNINNSSFTSTSRVFNVGCDVVLYLSNQSKATLEQNFISKNNVENALFYCIGNSNLVANYITFLDNNYSKVIIVNESKYDLDFNWWETNDKPNEFVNNWAVMTANPIRKSNQIELSVFFNKVSNGERIFELDKVLPTNIPVLIVSSTGDYNATFNTITDGESNYVRKYLPFGDNKFINITSGLANIVLPIETRVIYVDCNFNGTELGTIDNPYKSFNTALKNAQDKDKIFIKNGIYSFDDVWPFGTDLDIIGESKGNVILDVVNSGGLYLRPVIKSTFINLTITSSVASSIDTSLSSANIEIIECSFENFTVRSQSASVFQSGGNTVLKNVVITNIKTTGMGISSTYSILWSRKSLDIDNLTVINNDVSVLRGFIRAEGKLNIKNSNFINNSINDIQYAGGIKGILFEGNLKLEYSNIYNNTCKLNGGNANLDYNWWGSNTPSYSGVNNWIILDAYFTPERSIAGDLVNITATFNKYMDKDGNIFDLEQGCIPDGIPVTFTLPDGENVTAITKDGKAMTSYTLATTGNDIVIKANDAVIYYTAVPKTLRIDLADNYTATEDANITINAPGLHANMTLIIDGNSETVEVNNTYVKTIENVKAGVHSVLVYYEIGGSIKYDVKTFTADKLQSQISLDNVTINVGESVPVEFSPANDATGRVFIDINGKKIFKVLEDGKVSIVLEDFAIGTYDVSVYYEGDGKYLASEDTFTITVNGFNANLKANASDIKVGENATVNIEIDSKATGKVALTIGNAIYPVTFKDGKACVIIPDLANGTYTATIKFDGDAKFLADEITVTFNVTKQVLPDDINVSTEIPEGTTAPEFTVNLPEDATGNFTVTVDGTPYTEELVNGSATVKVPEQTPGNHTISTSYSGDDKYDGFTSDNKTFDVPKASIPGGENALNMTTPADSATPSYSIILPNDATGNLTVTVDGKDKYSQALVNGSATVTLPELQVGKHDITVAYSGDDKYSGISKTTSVNVPEKAKPATQETTKAKTIITAKKKTYKAKTKVKKYTITLKSGKKPVNKVQVTLKIKGKTYKAKTNAKGKATFKIKKLTKKGKYSAVIKFAGNKNYKATSKKVKITVKK